MKFAGAGIVFICSLLIGYFLSERSKQSLILSEEIYRIMKYVRDEICLNRTPTKIILSRISDCDGHDDLYSAYENKLSILNSDENRIFSDFCSGIGKGGAEVQRGGFDALLSQYESLLIKRREKVGASARLYISLSVFFGLAAVIIFL